MRLQSEKIYLRAVESSDATRIMLWENNPSFWHVSETEIPFSLHDIHHFIENSQHFRQTGQLRLIICLNENDLPVGCVDFYDADFKHRRAGIGILIAEPENKEKGYASEAIRLLVKYGRDVFDFQQVYAMISVSNEPSLRLFEACGFEKSGVLKSWRKTGKNREDIAFYQLILEEL